MNGRIILFMENYEITVVERINKWQIIQKSSSRAEADY